MADLPPYVRKNLEFFLDHEPDDPDRFGPLILLPDGNPWQGCPGHDFSVVRSGFNAPE